MPTGRRPIPTAIKKLTGNPGKRPLNENEPTPRSLTDAPPCPKHLTGVARSVWTRVAEELQLCHLLSPMELDLLENYCEAIGRSRDARKAYKKLSFDKLATPAEKQTMRLVIGAIKQASDEAKMIACELGITPSSRSRLQGDPNVGSHTPPAPSTGAGQAATKPAANTEGGNADAKPGIKGLYDF